ncbi:sugar ABC transporter ATP-binding protein [Arthrobacter sp. SLBN-112]|uniref:sugar ABC transporter ATP-binding protein n=1 Tax=Arthrobacter sp. SLBN-112 TaxID=2768452 RepID=UPI0027B0F1A5|nr:sugar ABC transporter ATP-binding protein [Arthrobacter sp. SLBN-112]MDQ0799015.1 ribose transport system ATP-binding protein [Arthrobacter sp. SLBN-112]
MSVSTKAQSAPTREGSNEMAVPLLRMVGIEKEYGPVKALNGVDFELFTGEVHGILGQNGAGKSTLIKVLAGAEEKTRGRQQLNGKDVNIRSTAEAQKAGISVVYQDLSLIPSMSVAANLYLGREPKTNWGLIDHKKLKKDARNLLEEHGFDLDPSTVVASLPFAYRQMTEIAKALLEKAQILVLDEPTSALTADEEKILFEAVRNVVKRGVGVIYVTHRLSEIFRLTDRVTVFRDGKNVLTVNTSETDMSQLVNAIVGRKLADAYANNESSAMNRSFIRAEEKDRITLRGVSNRRLHDLNLSVASGEVYGLAGNIGSGRTEILETLFGLLPIKGGSLELDGISTVLRNPSDAIRHGIALASEDRHESGLVLEHSIERNIAMPQLGGLSRQGIYNRAKSSARSLEAIERLGIKARDAATQVKTLSGGNQQKVVFGKWLEPRPRVLLLDEPSVGVDVGARSEIYEIIHKTAEAGSSVIIASSDLAELLQLCDTIAIVTDGTITSVIPRTSISSEQHLHQLIQEFQP